jgi:RNA polymerase-binding transcription factor DksA
MREDPASTPEETAALARLLAEEVRVLDLLAGSRLGFQEIVDASADSNADDEHDPEGSTIAFERSQLRAMIQQGERHLREIEEARAKVAEGRFGRCERCGQPIAAARLEAHPVARTCIGCATAAGGDGRLHRRE